MNIHSLKLKFIVILFGILSAVLLLQTFYFVPKLENYEQQEALETQQKMAQQLATTFEISFQQTVAEIEAIAKLPTIKSLEVDKLDRILTEMNTVTQFFNYYFIVDPKGRWISYPSKPHLQGKKIQVDYWIGDVLKSNATTFLDVHLATDINTMVSGFVSPIYSDDGVVAALLRGVITVSDKNTLFRTNKNDRGW